MDNKEQMLRQQIKDSGVQMLKEGLVQGTWGNISIRLDENHMLVTPSGLDYLSLTPEDMSVVDLTTMEWVGSKKPTSERKIHAAILRDRPEINVVLHSHPTECSILASARCDLPVMNEKQKKFIGGEVRCAKYGLPGTKKLTANTVAAMKDRNGCFLANHGVFACGTSLENAFEACRTMEEGCKQYIEQKVLEKTGATHYSHAIAHDLFVKTYSKKK